MPMIFDEPDEMSNCFALLRPPDDRLAVRAASCLTQPVPPKSGAARLGGALRRPRSG